VAQQACIKSSRRRWPRPPLALAPRRSEARSDSIIAVAFRGQQQHHAEPTPATAAPVSTVLVMAKVRLPESCESGHVWPAALLRVSVFAVGNQAGGERRAGQHARDPQADEAGNRLGSI